MEKRKRLVELDPEAMEFFASELLLMIRIEQEGPRLRHDLQVLEESMEHLKRDSRIIKNSKPETDEYDFARNDCKNLIDSTRKWLELEGLI